MSDEKAINLADPSFEPTDEQLAGLMKRAFVDVAARNRAALAKMREEISRERAAVRRRLRGLGG